MSVYSPVWDTPIVSITKEFDHLGIFIVFILRVISWELQSYHFWIWKQNKCKDQTFKGI